MMEKRFDIVHDFYTKFFTTKTNLMKTSQKRIEPIGINFSSWQLVIHLSVFCQENNRGMTTSELAEDLIISRQAVLKQMKCLLEEELIVVQENNADKRSPYYCVSEKGEELCQYVVEEIFADWMMESLKDFSTDEIQAATKILAHLTKF